MLVSVIVFSYKRPDCLKQCLRLLKAQQYPEVELIAVCQEYSPEYCASLEDRLESGHPLVVLSYPTALGPPGARNEGLRRARGDIVAFVDDDVEMGPDWLDEILKPYSDPEVGGVGGFVQHPGQGDFLHRVYYRLFGLSASYYRVSKSGFNAAPITRPQGDQPAEWLSGCNVSFRRAAIKAVGMFDEGICTYGFFEDVDYALRVRKAGWKLMLAPAASVLHHSSPLNRPRMVQTAFDIEFGRIYILAKHFGSVSSWLPRYAVRLGWHSVNLALIGLKNGQPALPLAAVRGAIAGLKAVRSKSRPASMV